MTDQRVEAAVLAHYELRADGTVVCLVPPAPPAPNRRPNLGLADLATTGTVSHPAPAPMRD
ncbi:MAG: hypothetical protein HOV66_12215 [Streptomycetaceae bacterium]|nr:hypothetical protein [Streptomycetaceae bacterium]